MNKTIFVIDDDPLLRMIIQKMMGKLDGSLTFVPCENGRDGLDKLHNWNGNSSECFIILDLNMPVLDGWGFLDEFQINSSKATFPVKIFIVSSSVDRSDLERSQSYACVKKFYHKPLGIQDMSEILSGHFD